LGGVEELAPTVFVGANGFEREEKEEGTVEEGEFAEREDGDSLRMKLRRIAFRAVCFKDWIGLTVLILAIPADDIIAVEWFVQGQKS
jgi:hypothetical protein